MSKPAQVTPQGPTQDVIGGGIAAGVVRQLIQREELVSQGQKSKEHLLFFNGNGAWARMVSSVNTLTETETNQLAAGKATVDEVVGSKNLAYNNVLMGGTLKQSTPSKPTALGGGVNESKHNPIDVDSNGYIKAGNLKDSAYHNYESLGFRPTPGIESVAVKSKGTYGTLREAEVNFKVWTLEDLEVMQALYLRPGYSILLEWGHSLQLQSSENPGTLNSQITTYKKFLQDNVDNPMLTFEKELLEIAQQSDYNYDSFVGFVSNFDWSLNEQGGYDCKVKIIAKGSVLESIACTFDPSSVYPPEQMNRLREDKGKEERKSIFHKLFTEMQYWVDGGVNSTEIGQVVDSSLTIINPFASPEDKAVAAASALVAIPGAVGDILFGNDEELLAALDDPQGAEAKTAMQNDAFRAKFEKLKNGDSFKFKGKTYSFGPTKAGSSGFADLEEEELEYYLNKQFGEYGLTFSQAGTGDNISVVDQNGQSFEIEVDNTFTADDYREGLSLSNFIQDRAVIPESQLTEEQKADRERRQQAGQQQVIDLIKDITTANENQADLTGLFSEGDVMPIYTKSNFVRASSAHFRKTLSDFAAFRLKDLELKDTGFFDNDNLNEFWIPLHVVLDVYNNYVTLIDGTKSKSKGTNSTGRKLTQFYTGHQDEVLSGVYEKKLKYLTTDQHFSINPMVCILPKKPRLTILKDSEGKKLEWPDGQGTAFPMGVVWKNGFHQQVTSAFAQGLLRGETNDILNILISVQFLKDELDKIAKADEDSDKNENNNIVYFLKIVLKAMTEAMGGVNDFDIFYDDRDDLFYIVDRKITPALRNLIPTLSLSGVRSTMTNVQISSQISQNIGNMVSIAAQGTGGNSKDNVGPLLKWNAGLLDRHIRHKAQDNTDDNSKVTQKEEKRENPEDKRLKEWIKDYYDYWREFNGDKAWDNGDFNPDLVAAVSTFHKKFCQKYVVEAYYKQEDDPKPPPGVVPVELSFTTMGLGGLKIGQAFQIEQGLLPQKYAEDFGYIITGLSHNIQDSKWTTEVKTQFYSLKPPTPEEIAAFEKSSKAASEGYRETNASGGSVGPVVVDETPPISGEKVDYDSIKAAVVGKGYKWDSREWAINIVGIRNYNSFRDNKIPLSNKFDDIMTISWIENGVKKAEKFACTTDPGKYWLVDSINSAGTAILKEGQYINSHGFGTHKRNGGYPALVQINPVTVWRDRNGDRFYDFVNPQTGIFGINIHKASTRTSGSTEIDKWSAGCQVVSKPGSLSRILEIANQATRKIQQNKFTYTLINSRDIKI
jgi:hypothetical protein